MKGFGRAGLSALATSTLVIGACVAGAGAANADANFSFTRVTGHTRYDVSAQVANQFGSASHVIIASGEDGKFGDALAANYLAGVLNAPVLLTQLNQTPDVIKAALAKTGAKDVTIVGGPLSVSDAQAQALTDAGYNVNRLSGHTRYDTDAAIIKQGATTGDTAIIATGEKFPDALSAGPLAFAKKLPVGLVQLGTAPQAVIDALKAQGVNKAIVLGGDLSVSQETRQQLENNGIKIINELKGGNRAQVATQVADLEIGTYGFKSDRVNVATGREFGTGADALSAGPLTGQQNRPLLITAGDPKVGTTQAIGQDLLNWLQGHARTLTGSDNLLFGGPLSISDAEKAAMEKAAQTVTSNQSYNVSPSQATMVNTKANGDQTVTFSGISASQVSLRLIDCKQDSTNPQGVVSFADTTPKDSKADAAPATNATITQVNGVTSTYGTSVDNVNVTNGAVTVTVNSASAGCSQLVAFEDKNSDQALNLDANNQPTEPFAISGAINAVTPTQIDFTNSPTTAPYGSYTATIQLEDTNGKDVALAGVPVRFYVQDNTGQNVSTGTAKTDANGQATYTFTQADPNAAAGDSTPVEVFAAADLNQNGNYNDPNDGFADQTVTFTDAAAAPQDVAITSPKSGTVDQTGTNQTVSATVTDQYGKPVAGQTVKFDVTGTNNAPALHGTGTTNASGVATFTYSRNVATTDTITATDAAANGNDSDQTTVVWSKGVASVNGTNYATLADAISAASAGDTITASGTFTEQPVVSKAVTIQGTSGATLNGTFVIQGANGVTVSGFAINPASYQGTVTGVYLDNAQNTTLSNDSVTGADSTSLNDNGIGVVNTTGGNVEQATIKNSTFKNLTQGVYANPSADFTETGNTFTNNIAGSANDAASTVTGNTFANNDQGVGISVSGVTISGNTFTTDTPASDIYVYANGAPVSSAYLNGVLTSNTYNPGAKIDSNNNIVPASQ